MERQHIGIDYGRNNVLEEIIKGTTDVETMEELFENVTNFIWTYLHE